MNIVPHAAPHANNFQSRKLKCFSRWFFSLPPPPPSTSTGRLGFLLFNFCHCHRRHFALLCCHRRLESQSFFPCVRAVSANKLNLCCRKHCVCVCVYTFILQSLFQTHGLPTNRREENKQKKCATSFSIWSHTCAVCQNEMGEKKLTG